jgi:hypothetical protein
MRTQAIIFCFFLVFRLVVDGAARGAINMSQRAGK